MPIIKTKHLKQKINKAQEQEAEIEDLLEGIDLAIASLNGSKDLVKTQTRRLKELSEKRKRESEDAA